MLGKSPSQNQRDMFRPLLRDFIDPKHELVLLAQKIAYQKRKKRKKFRRRAAIEPVIGHLKKHFRMQQNYLMGQKAPKINAMLAATGWNLKKLMEKLVEENLHAFFQLTQINLILKNKHTYQS